jgi:hypothetical protein
VSAKDVEDTLRDTGAWKTPGTDDNLPAGFLKACGEPVAEAIAKLANASFALAYFPQRFRKAGVIVLRKPGKTTDQYQTAGGYRPIALLSTIGKVIEALIGRRVARAAEENGLLPDGQMGNRPGRSTEVAIRFVTDAVRTAWREGGVASLLQLDIKGAFDTVNHIRMIDTLRDLGYPRWVTSWVRSYLTNRTIQLHFDGETSAPIDLQAGVPQGSPLSPILFLLYIASLYQALVQDPRLLVVGFADDTNLMAFSQDEADNCRQLQEAWETCQRWAVTRGMEFAPEKSELLHFSRAHRAPQQRVRLGTAEIAPVESARFLGVWLDRKLRWRAHLKQINKKLATQQLALSKLAKSTWGCSLIRAREIYTKVIRSAIAYGAAAWHLPTTDKQQGIVKKLHAAQSKSLRIVAGAYKATPVRSLETETAVPPLDLYLNKRLADFETRLHESGRAVQIRDACVAIASRLRSRRRRRPAERPADRPRAGWDGERSGEWAREWRNGLSSDEALRRDWETRWTRELARATTQRRGRTVQPADNPDFDKALEKHETLRKHESSLLVQIRTGKVGLRAFLFERRVPDVWTPLCRCGRARETPLHLTVFCDELQDERLVLKRAVSPRALRTSRDFASLTTDPATAGAVVRWLLSLRRFPEFRLAEEIAREDEVTARTGGAT